VATSPEEDIQRGKQDFSAEKALRCPTGIGLAFYGPMVTILGYTCEFTFSPRVSIVPLPPGGSRRQGGEPAPEVRIGPAAFVFHSSQKWRLYV
jgi:hypothetical protein